MNTTAPRPFASTASQFRAPLEAPRFGPGAPVDIWQALGLPLAFSRPLDGGLRVALRSSAFRVIPDILDDSGGIWLEEERGWFVEAGHESWLFTRLKRLADALDKRRRAMTEHPDVMNRPLPSTPRIRVEEGQDAIRLFFTHSPVTEELARRRAGARWDYEQKCWSVPLSRKRDLTPLIPRLHAQLSLEAQAQRAH